MNSESFDLAYIAHQDVSADHITFIHDLSLRLHQTTNPLRLAYHFLFEIPEDKTSKSIVSRLVPRDYFLKHSHLCSSMELRFEDEYFIDDLVDMLERGILPLIRFKDCLAKDLVNILDTISFNSPDELILKATFIKQQGGRQLTLCQALLVQIQNYLDRLYGCVSALILANNLEEARNICLEHLKSDPRNAVIYGVLGAIEKKNGNAAGALKFLDRAYFYAGDRSIVGQNFVSLLTEQAYFAKAAAITMEIAADRLPDTPPLVSFLIAAYNEELYIADSITSCLSQTYPNIEVCVTNDGSTDNTAEILKNSFSHDPRVRIASFATNRGKVQAFNAAYQMATGTYFALLGADDLAYPDRIENAYRHLVRHGLDMVVGGLLYCDDCLQPIAKKPPVRRREDYVLETFFALNPTWGGTMFFNRRVAEVAFPIPATLLFEDWWIGFNAALNRMRIDYLPVNFIIYRMHGANDCANADPSNRAMAMAKDFRRHFSYYEAFKQRIVDRADMTEEEKHHYYTLIDEQVAYKRQIMEEYGHLLAPATSVGSAPQARGRRETLSGLKILFVCHDFPPYKLAGAQLFALNLAKELITLGHDVRVLYPVNLTARSADEDRTPYATVRTDFQGIPVYQLTVDDTVGDLYRHPQYCFAHPEVDEAFRGLLAEEQFDLVHIHLLYRLSSRLPLIARELGVPTVATLHDYWLLCAMGHLLDTRGRECSGPESPEKCATCIDGFVGPPRPDIASFFRERESTIRLAFGAIDACFSPSSFLADIHALYGHRRPEVLPLGWLPLPPVRRRPNDGRVIFGYLGQIIGRKGLDILVAALASLPHENWELQIHGEVYQPDFFAAVQECFKDNPRIKYCGPFTSTDLPRLYAKIDVAVVPSRRENYPLTVMEALSARVPVIAADVGGVREIMQPEVDGVIVPSNDVAALKKALVRFCEDPTAIDRMRDTIRPTKTISANAQEYDRIYRFMSLDAFKSRAAVSKRGNSA